MVTFIVSVVLRNLFAIIAFGLVTVIIGAVLVSKKGARTAKRVAPQA